MSKPTREEFYHWWSGLTNEERVSCWYDLDAMAHGEVVKVLRDKLSTAEAKLVEAERDWRALDKLLGLTSEEDGTVVFRVLDDGSRHCQARMVPGRGDDARMALVALATKLVGLLDKEGG